MEGGGYLMTEQDANVAMMRFINNVLIIGRKRNGIGEIERKAGLSTGYLSRVAKKNMSVSLPVALLLADASGESLVNLLIMDYEKVFIDQRIKELESEIESLRSTIKNA